MRLIGIVIALVLAVAAGYIYLTVTQPAAPAPNAQISPQSQTAQPVQTVDVLVASRSIPIGEVLKPEMIGRQPWPSHLVLNGFVTAGTEAGNIVGMVTRSNFQEGEPIIISKLSNPSDPNFLAAALEPGYKVASIQVDNISAVSGFLFPGDYVDILVTHDLPVESDKNATGGVSADKKASYTEMLLTNVKVLAVDDRSTAGQAQPEGTQKRPPASVSLEVTLDQAQKLRLAQETGYVSLALRSLKDKDVEESTSPTSVADLTHTSDNEKAKTDTNNNENVRVIRGTELKDINNPGGQAQTGFMLAPASTATAAGAQ